MQSNWLITAYLIILISLGFVATDIYLPSLPSLMGYFEASENEVQMTLFTYLLSFSLTPLFFGPLSDHFGRKKVILGGLVATLLATVACVFADSIYTLSAYRFLQGFGTGAVMISARAMVTDLFSGKELTKQMSLISMLMPLVLALAPTLGGALQAAFNWQSTFIFMILMTFCILVWVMIREETVKNSDDSKIHEIVSTYRSHLKNRLFVIFSMNFIIPAFGFFGYLTVSSFLFQDVIGLTPFEYGLLSLYIGGTILASGYLNIRLIHHYPLNQIIRFGSCLVVLSGMLLFTFYYMDIMTKWSLLGPVLLFFTCAPLCSANSASKSLKFVKSNFGAATALLTTLQLFTGAFTSFIMSLVSDASGLSLAVCFLAVGVLSLVNLKYADELELSTQPG